MMYNFTHICNLRTKKGELVKYLETENKIVVTTNRERLKENPKESTYS